MQFSNRKLLKRTTIFSVTLKKIEGLKMKLITTYLQPWLYYSRCKKKPLVKEE
jgi:hypothetical protein